jgi:hypothetical protein
MAHYGVYQEHMRASLRFLKAHLNAEREPLLLGPAPAKVEIAWAAQQTIAMMIHSFESAVAILEQLAEFKPIPDWIGHSDNSQ